MSPRALVTIAVGYPVARRAFDHHRSVFFACARYGAVVRVPVGELEHRGRPLWAIITGPFGFCRHRRVYLIPSVPSLGRVSLVGHVSWGCAGCGLCSGDRISLFSPEGPVLRAVHVGVHRDPVERGARHGSICRIWGARCNGHPVAFAAAQPARPSNFTARFTSITPFS